MRNIISLLFGFLILATPSLCAAGNVTTWDLVNKTEVEGWNTNGFDTVQLIPHGFAIRSETPGQFLKVSEIRHPVDHVSITYITPTGASGQFFWRPKGMTGNEVFQIPITFQPTGTTQTLVLNMSQVQEWDARSDRIGFAFEGGVEFILQSMEFSGPTQGDKIFYPLKTFVTLDRARPYSINFLWGPMMTYSEDHFYSLFSQIPPLGDSWNIVFYVILSIALIFAILLKRLGKTESIKYFFLLLAAIWVIYDLRMGVEFISYAKMDIRTWWSQPMELKDYRDRGSFLAFTEVMQEFTKDQESYVFIANRGWPYWGTMKYVQWPALPVRLEEDTTGVDTWVVYKRSDIILDSKNRLSVDDEAISPPGKILMRFEPGAFVFRTDS